MEEAEAGDADVPTTLSAEDVDITDLHTESPTVVYRGMEYSCRWATAVGTDMFFHKPGVTLPGETDAGGPPIAPQLAERVECVGMSAVRLVAVSARKLVASENNESPATPGDSHDADGGDGELPDEPAERQKAFLSMLESIQRRNGDADAVMQD